MFNEDQFVHLKVVYNFVMGQGHLTMRARESNSRTQLQLFKQLQTVHRRQHLPHRLLLIWPNRVLNLIKQALLGPKLQISANLTVQMFYKLNLHILLRTLSQIVLQKIIPILLTECPILRVLITPILLPRRLIEVLATLCPGSIQT